MSDFAVYESYRAFCDRVGVAPAEFERWTLIRWTLGLAWASWR